MSICEQCGVDVPTMNQVVKVRLGMVHYFCSEEHAQAALEKPPIKAEELPPLEDAPRPPAKRRGRPAGSRNKPKA